MYYKFEEWEAYIHWDILNGQAAQHVKKNS